MKLEESDSSLGSESHKSSIPDHEVQEDKKTYEYAPEIKSQNTNNQNLPRKVITKRKLNSNSRNNSSSMSKTMISKIK